MNRKPNFGDFIAIADMDDWAEFWRDNRDALESEVGDEETCIALAQNCCLLVGGGAAPSFRIGFID